MSFIPPFSIATRRRLALWVGLCTALGCAHTAPPPATGPTHATDEPLRWRTPPGTHAIDCDVYVPQPCWARDGHEVDAAKCEARIAELGEDCKRANGDPCTCARYGVGLTSSTKRENDVEGLRRLDEACIAGIGDACGHAELVEHGCAVDPKSSPVCSALRKAGRVPRPEPVVKGLAKKRLLLPEGSLGCFRVNGVLVSYENYDSSHGRATHPLRRDPWDVCIANDRMTWIAEPGLAEINRPDVWDQAHGGWFDTNRPELTFFDDAGVALFYLRDRILERPDDHYGSLGRLERLEGADLARAMSASASVPSRR